MRFSAEARSVREAGTKEAFEKLPKVIVCNRVASQSLY